MILENQIHNKSALGNFWYNTLDFKIINKSTPFGKIQVLKYIGPEIIGLNINIPEGLKSTAYMFDGNYNLLSAPIIPASVRTTDNMFNNCSRLEYGIAMPYGVTSCNFMYQGCIKLKAAPDLPETIKNAAYMFSNCVSLVNPPLIPSNIKNISGMFHNCKSLNIIPDNAKQDYILLGCKRLNNIAI